MLSEPSGIQHVNYSSKKTEKTAQEHRDQTGL